MCERLRKLLVQLCRLLLLLLLLRRRRRLLLLLRWRLLRLLLLLLLLLLLRWLLPAMLQSFQLLRMLLQQCTGCLPLLQRLGRWL
jgi:hypothetical protein